MRFIYAQQTINVSSSARAGVTGRVVDNKTRQWNFAFNHVLDGTAQQGDVFTSGCKDIADSVIQGYNGTLLAYGQTGAGKVCVLG